MCPIGHGQGRADAAHFLDGEGLHEDVPVQATVFLTDGDPQDPDFSTFFEEIRWKPILLINLFLQRPQFIHGPFVHGFLDHALFISQREIHFPLSRNRQILPEALQVGVWQCQAPVWKVQLKRNTSFSQ